MSGVQCVKRTRPQQNQNQLVNSWRRKKKEGEKSAGKLKVTEAGVLTTKAERRTSVTPSIVQPVGEFFWFISFYRDRKVSKNKEDGADGR